VLLGSVSRQVLNDADRRSPSSISRTADPGARPVRSDTGSSLTERLSTRWAPLGLSEAATGAAAPRGPRSACWPAPRQRTAGRGAARPARCSSSLVVRRRGGRVGGRTGLVPAQPTPDPARRHAPTRDDVLGDRLEQQGGLQRPAGGGPPGQQDLV